MIKFLFPGVDEEDLFSDDAAGPEEATEEGEAPESEDEGQQDEAPEQQEEEAAPRPMSKAQKEIIKLRERSQKAEEDLKKAQEELRRPAAALVRPDKEIWEEEEAALKNPDIQPWQRYAIHAARSGRQAEQKVLEIQRQTYDLTDRSDFDKLRTEKPRVYEKYKDRVEERLKFIRSKGNDVPRRVICQLLLGEDMLSGKLKPAKSPPVNRGRTPGARSDVGRPEKLSDADALAKRLEGVRI
jgi:hypothetical protein